MTKRVSVRFLNRALGMATGMAVGILSLASASAQTPPVPPEAPVIPAVPSAPSDPFPAAAASGAYAPPAAQPGGNDHDTVVGKIGIEVRKIGDFARTAGQDGSCPTPCTTTLNALSLRRWTTHDYAYSVGLALGIGGGATRPDPAMGAKTWDTYFGVGPTLGASFLLTTWKHLTVSYGPQADFVFFMPSGKGSKSLLVNLRGVVEGELHLGMIGVPAASVAVTSGIEASYLYATKDTKGGAPANITANRWTLAITGPQALWDLVTKVNLRYYF
jgi:hypothetical protein